MEASSQLTTRSVKLTASGPVLVTNVLAYAVFAFRPVRPPLLPIKGYGHAASLVIPRYCEKRRKGMGWDGEKGVGERNSGGVWVWRDKGPKRGGEGKDVSGRSKG